MISIPAWKDFVLDDLKSTATRDSNFPLAVNPITEKRPQNSDQSSETNTEVL